MNGGVALTVTGCRVRNTMADGINLNNYLTSTSSSLVTNSHFRNTGDDSLAIWSANDTASGGVTEVGNALNVFSFNTIEVPWRANGIALYGGTSNRVLNNVVKDPADYPGIMVANRFNPFPFLGHTVVKDNTLVRCGGVFYGTDYGALAICSDGGIV